MKISDQTIHLIDFECNTRTGVVEYGVASLRGGEMVAAHTRLCRGRAPIDERDRRWHGIGEADVHAQPPLEHDWELFKSLRESGPFGAHHALVEDTLLRQVWPYPGMGPDYRGGEGSTPEWGPWIDTRRLYEHHFPGLESYQLMDLVRLFRLEDTVSAWACAHCPEGRRKHHCALHDALASAALLAHIAALPGFERTDLSWLLRHSAPSRRERDRYQQGELL